MAPNSETDLNRRRFLYECNHQSSDLSMNMKISAKKKEFRPWNVVCGTYLSIHFEFLFTHFKLRDHTAEKVYC